MIVKLIGLLLILQGLVACGSENILDTSNPSNLTVEVNIADDGSGLVEIIAQADNTIEYQLWVGMATEPTSVNTTGQFEHAFTRPGNYQVEIRAYGKSGRYIKETRQVPITIGNNVSVGEGYTTPTSYEGYSLIWNDEFEGTGVNTNNWVFEIGTGSGGWGNKEVRYSRVQNGGGGEDVLAMEARREV